MIPGPTLIKLCSECSGLIKEFSDASCNTFGARNWTDGEMFAPMCTEKAFLVKCPYCHALVWIDELPKVDEIEPWDEKSYSGSEYRLRPNLEDYLSYLNKYDDIGLEKERYIRIRAWQEGNDKRREVLARTTAMTEKEKQFIETYSEFLNSPESKDVSKGIEVLNECGGLLRIILILKKRIPEELAHANTTIRKAFPREFNEKVDEFYKFEEMSEEEKDNIEKLYGLLDPSDEHNVLQRAEIRRELGDFEDAIELLQRTFTKDLFPLASAIRTLAEGKETLVGEFFFEDY